QPLAEATAALGVPRDRIEVVYDGVDAALFHPRDRREARRALARPEGEELALYVGYLKRSKGVLDLVEAFDAVAARRPNASLVLVGDGEDRAAVEAAAARVNAARGDGRVTLAGPVAH